ncbi:MAG: hypothetical protein ACRC5C_03785, partial [Bacilli bacterium]
GEVEAKYELGLSYEECRDAQAVESKLQRALHNVLDNPHAYTHAFPFESRHHDKHHFEHTKDHGMIGALAAGVIGSLLLVEALDFEEMAFEEVEESIFGDDDEGGFFGGDEEEE